MKGRLEDRKRREEGEDMNRRKERENRNRREEGIEMKGR